MTLRNYDSLFNIDQYLKERAIKKADLKKKDRKYFKKKEKA